MSCGHQCSVALPRDAVGWTAVCDYGIFYSYSLAFLLCYLDVKGKVNHLVIHIF